ncbi:MAG: hypothetical protein IPL55_05265 [Saprospiraceae bacterium]|nr:hypothetical protein [Saprospiraceae bacterium]
MKYLFSFIIILFTSSSYIFGQTLDDEIGFIYVKAEYLLQTGRNDEAVRNYNTVIARDPGYKEALIHRGIAKYALGAYKGSKNDALQSIEFHGILADNAALLGRSFAALGDQKAGISSLTVAINLDNKNPKYLLWRASVYESNDQKLNACSDYEAAMKLGDSEAEIKALNLCGIAKNKNTPAQVITSENADVDNTLDQHSNQSATKFEPTNQSTYVGDSTTVNIPAAVNQVPSEISIGDDSDPVIDENIPKDDNTVNSFVVDDDLTITISGQELGLRKMKEVPSILILSDENGKVSISICVNKDGIVTKAEFNASMSTIVQKSLVSLALRKAREFEFQQGKYDLQCGIMVFEIKGS